MPSHNLNHKWWDTEEGRLWQSRNYEEKEIPNYKMAKEKWQKVKVITSQKWDAKSLWQSQNWRIENGKTSKL